MEDIEKLYKYNIHLSLIENISRYSETLKIVAFVLTRPVTNNIGF